MALYEAVFIARGDLTQNEVEKLTEKFENIITDLKGKILKKEYWGLKNLAYKIKKIGRGHYFAFNIESNYDAIAEAKRVAGFNENVLRSSFFNVKDFIITPDELMQKQEKPVERRPFKKYKKEENKE